MTANVSKLETIQVLRGLAAVMIVLLHGFHEAGFEKPSYPLTIGVDIFFVISGFIMVYTSRAWFGHKGTWKKFITRRLIRIVPLYWFYTTVLVAIALILPSALGTAKLEGLHLLFSYLFIPHQRPAGELQPFLALGWTLNYEMYFYVVFAATLFLPMKKALIALTGFFVAASIAGSFIPFEYHALYFWTRPIVLEFVAGAWIGYLFLTGRKLPGYSVYLIPLVALGLVFHYELGDLRFWAGALAAALLVALAILPEKMANLAVPRPFSALGDASYTLYLAHPFMLAGAALALKFLPPWPLLGASVLGALFGGYILYIFIEKPLLALTKRVFLSHEKAL